MVRVSKEIHDLYSLLISNVWILPSWQFQTGGLGENYIIDSSLWSCFGTNRVFCVYGFLGTRPSWMGFWDGPWLHIEFLYNGKSSGNMACLGMWIHYIITGCLGWNTWGSQDLARHVAVYMAIRVTTISELGWLSVTELQSLQNEKVKLREKNNFQVTVI